MLHLSDAPLQVMLMELEAYKIEALAARCPDGGMKVRKMKDGSHKALVSLS
jgi:hypothetical protein